MSMPKGFKSKNGYGTSKSLGGITYHKVADIMVEKGYKMNHSTARNVYVSALTKIARRVTDLYGMELNERDLKQIAKDPRFQGAVSEFMRED